MRYTYFIGTAKEIAEQFNKDLYEARIHLERLEPFTEAVMWISKGLYQIVAAYYGADMCLYSNGESTIRGIEVEKVINDFSEAGMMFEVFAMKGGGHFPTENGAYMYKEGKNERRTDN